ncbi:MAG: ABC transporter ATP-binding protein [Fastidiosipilaceae bacterium]|jgi:NitT/TauT family transport system ATP-binding protein
MGAISISGLSFRYDKGPIVLNNIDLDIDDGEFVCVLGASGCGKSTLLRLLSGLSLPTNGRICIDGVPVTGPGPDRMIVFQNYSLFPWLTALGNVEFAVKQANRNLSKAEIRRVSAEYLKKVGMWDAAKKYPYQLSGGMSQRVAIARALSMNTDILLLDEPFGALDAKIRKELHVLLESLWKTGDQKQKTVVFVTHDIEEAIRLADRIVFMRQGVIMDDMIISRPRPRTAIDTNKDEDYIAIKRHIMGLFNAVSETGGDDENLL